MEDQKYRDEEDLAEKLDSFKSKTYEGRKLIRNVLNM